MCLERRTHTEAVWSEQLTFSEYWGLLPTQGGADITHTGHTPLTLELTDVIPIFLNIAGFPYTVGRGLGMGQWREWELDYNLLMYCGLVSKDFWSPVDVNDVIEGLQ